MRGFGIAAGRDLSLAAKVAARAEDLGFGSVWTNDTPGGDGLSNAAAMLEATRSLRVGVGALPCDRWTPKEIERRLADFPSLGRLVLVVGAGRAPSPLVAVKETVLALRERLGEAPRLGIAALGPRMCRLGGRVADTVLLNWATPERILWSAEKISEGAKSQGSNGRRRVPEIAAYVRVAVGEGADALLSEEARRYAGAPHYARHFEAMGCAPAIAVAEPPSPDLLRPYEEILDETVVRAVPSAPGFEELDRILLEFRP